MLLITALTYVEDNLDICSNIFLDCFQCYIWLVGWLICLAEQMAFAVEHNNGIRFNVNSFHRANSSPLNNILKIFLKKHKQNCRLILNVKANVLVKMNLCCVKWCTHMVIIWYDDKTMVKQTKIGKITGRIHCPVCVLCVLCVLCMCFVCECALIAYFIAHNMCTVPC